MKLRELETNVFCTFKEMQAEGDLANRYVPFKNLLQDNQIKDFQTEHLKYDLQHPINMEVQNSFDGSVNLILNDDKNTPKMINSRFSVQEESTFIIPDHKGNKDTNLYENSQLEQDTRLYKTVDKIPVLEFEGLLKGGNLKCGSYHFYFKLSDNDGNETDFILESGLVTCHVGEINSPHSIRMGMSNENSEKAVIFNISNLDTSYDYIKVYYTRTTSDETGIDVTYAYCIDEKYTIQNNTKVIITGFESQFEITLEEINPAFQYCQQVKTQAQCQNMLFFGNIYKPELDHVFFEKVSLLFKPTVYQNSDHLGSFNHAYLDFHNKYGYYNAKNLYYKLGYFPTEYYRLGIVYILNDGTLTPVFNIRGCNIPETTVSWTGLKDLSTNEEGLVKESLIFENTKGVIKIPNLDVIDANGCIKPLGIQIQFSYDSDKDGFYKNLENENCKYDELLKSKIKGFFFVRQNRIPTFYAQGLVIGKTTNDYGNIPVVKKDNNYVAESFLTRGNINTYEFTLKSEKEIDKIISTKSEGNLLHNNYVEIKEDNVENKAIIVPEAQVRQPIFNSLFTSDEFKVEEFKKLKQDTNIEFKNKKHVFASIRQYEPSKNNIIYTEKLTIVPDSIKLTTDGENYFSAEAGEQGEVLKVVDVNYNINSIGSQGDDGKENKILTNSDSKIRGEFGLYVGTNLGIHDYGTIVNIRSKDYNPKSRIYLENQFVLRSNSQEPYYAISDRLESNTLEKSINCFRGDCYINQVTHRLHRNFVDNDLPLNDNIVDPLTWHNNYVVVQKSDPTIIDGKKFVVNKPSVSFYRKWNMNNNNKIVSDHTTFKETIPSLSTLADDITGDVTWMNFGSTKINKGDLNAVPLGTWVTFTCLSNVNLAMRDVDMTVPGEASLFNKPRGFYPLQAMTKNSSGKQPESSVMNGAINVTLSKRHNIIQPDVPWIKNKFDTRIMYSDIAVTDAFKNGYRVFQGKNYRDYPKTYGSIVALKELNGDLIAVMEHGILRIPVNERAVAAQGSGGMVYINTSNVLPENPLVISDSIGSLWQDSVIKTTGLEGQSLIYGVDTVAKKIWVTDGSTVKIISDFKVQKFLNDNINFITSDKQEIVGEKNCKTHYNAFKRDVIFTFYNKDKEWSLCFNEVLQRFITFYSWIPAFSANIDNIYFSFDKENYSTNEYNNALWKHGQSGNFEGQGLILPTTWYGKTHTFEYEFIVNKPTIVQKIFNNLKIISNKTAPQEFTYEIVGETYDWFKYKDIITWINKKQQEKEKDTSATPEEKTLNYWYKLVLNHTPLYIQNNLYQDFPIGEFDPNIKFKKLPFIKRVRSNDTNKWEANSTDVILVEDVLLNEDRISTKQYGNDIKKVGRVKGNMQYLEDLWDIEIRPTNFKEAYLENNELKLKSLKQERIRDKYIKIRVKYSGKDLAVIQGLKTFYTISYA